MNILTTEGVSKAYGLRVLFSDVTISLDAGQKTGLIGLNGAGKTTLLKIIAGVAEADSGTIWRNPKARIHFLPQEPQFQPGQTVLESVLDGDLPVMDVIRRYEDAVARDDAAAVLKLTEEMDASQAWELEQQARVILQELGITDYRAKTDTLSGGQRKRLGLARALIVPCDLFLDCVADSMIELDRGHVYSYTGSYVQFLEMRQTRIEGEEAAAARRANLIRRETAWIRRGAQARSTKQKARIERYEALCAMETNKPSGSVEILDTSVRLGKTIIDMDGVAFAYPGGQPLFHDVTYHVVKHDRIGIIGANGVGKSTLLKVIAGDLTPSAGQLVVGQTVRFGFFRQQLPEFDEGQRVIDYVQEAGHYVTNLYGETISASRLLEQFLFTEEMQYTYIAKLSGGERRRLYLLRLLMGQPNVLLLDEPTNDLDIPTLTVLEQYLDTYQGVVLVVSHDRYFLDRVADKLFVLEAGTWSRYYGDYSAYLDEKIRHRTDTAPEKKEKAAAPALSQQPKPAPVKKGLSAREKEELAKITQELPRYESLLKGLNAAVAAAGSDYETVAQLMEEQRQAQAKVDELTERWCELEDLAAE